MSFLRSSSINAVLLDMNGPEWETPSDNEHEVNKGIIALLKHIILLCKKEDECSAMIPSLTKALEVITTASERLERAEKASIKDRVALLTDFRRNQVNNVDDIEQFGKAFSQIHVTNETLPYWRKLQVWLQKVHDLTTALLLKNKKTEIDDEGFVKPLQDGSYPCIDFVDKGFKTITHGVSKYSLIRHYGLAAKDIETAVRAYEARQLGPRSI